MDGEKEYEFVIQWGAETDSSDSEGKITSRSDKIPTKDEILTILPEFTGPIKQTPPVYSAIKINGKRAYDLARQGKDVQMPEREIEIYRLEFLDTLPRNQSKFRVLCSKGTYVRSLGRDIARKLQTTGHLVELRRTKCGIFNLSDKILLENLENMVYGNFRKEFLLPLETSLRGIAVMDVSEEEAAKLKQGQKLSPKSKGGFALAGTLMAAISPDGLAAIVRIEETRISPIRVFNL
jgi:tRNA pseudouridine55 synthase